MYEYNGHKFHECCDCVGLQGFQGYQGEIGLQGVSAEGLQGTQGKDGHRIHCLNIVYEGHVICKSDSVSCLKGKEGQYILNKDDFDLLVYQGECDVNGHTVCAWLPCKNIPKKPFFFRDGKSGSV